MEFRTFLSRRHVPWADIVEIETRAHYARGGSWWDLRVVRTQGRPLTIPGAFAQRLRDRNSSRSLPPSTSIGPAYPVAGEAGSLTGESCGGCCSASPSGDEHLALPCCGCCVTPRSPRTAHDPRERGHTWVA
ncbi:hypothetical protein [Streptomyces albus]|uniref:hypothetical protein n=1 Tax=Streptomyces albus TaxID=1888 RepID=UPI003D15BD0A